MKIEKVSVAKSKLENIANLKGSLLIASPIMIDSRFKKSVILVCDVKFSGAFGLIIKQDEVVSKHKKIVKNTIFKDDVIYFGGPVGEHMVFIIHSGDVLWPQSLKLSEHLFITSFVDAVKEISLTPRKPAQYIIVAGYTNWSAGQLEREMMLGLWVYAHEEDIDMIFADAKKDRWKHYMKKLEIDANSFALYAGTS